MDAFSREHSFSSAEVADTGGLFVCAGLRAALDPNPIKHPSLPYDQLDVLLVDEIGKDISGADFDTKVIGRIMNIYEKECERPRITRIVLRDLSAKTGGNAIGLGLADYVHRRVVNRMDAEMTALNCITAVAPEKARIPIVLSTDRRALEAAFRSIGLWDTTSVRMA